MAVQGRVVTPREQMTGLEHFGSRLRRWDLRLGAAYATLVSQGLTRLLGRLLTVLVMSLLMFGKFHAVLRLLGSDRPASGDLTAWTATLYLFLQVPFLALALLLVIVRRRAVVGIARASGILAALAGSVAPTFLVYESNVSLDSVLAPVALPLLLLGMVWAIWSLAALGRCFSTLPEVRGLVTSGPYRWVRHPVYLGEITAALGVLLPILSPTTVTVFAVFCVFQLWRTRNEESVLSATFPEYADYRRRTARLLPALW